MTDQEKEIARKTITDLMTENRELVKRYLSAEEKVARYEPALQTYDRLTGRWTQKAIELYFKIHPKSTQSDIDNLIREVQG